MGQKQSQTHTQCPHEGPNDRQRGPKVDALVPGVDAVGAYPDFHLEMTEAWGLRSQK